MKNLALALGVLIIIIIAVFAFAATKKNQNDTIIPSPIPVASPSVDIITNESSSSAQKNPFPILKKDAITGKKATISTSKGDIVIELSADSPIAASNFIYLANKHFYDRLTFHRREENFVIQGGDPKGDGTGGPGYTFPDERVVDDYKRGTVAMANTGPNTNGSQFFIVLVDLPTLPKKYTIFGQVIEGLDVIDKIKVGDKINKISILE